VWRGLGVFAFLGLVTILLTWPIAVSLNSSFTTHPDYFSNLWNIWWVRKSLFELGSSPYWTDFLFFPDGVSLALHTLSFANSIPGALLSYAVGLQAAFNMLTVAHFWLSAWAFYLLAHYLTGSRLGSLLGGIVYAFCPFHYYYLPMINIVSMESLPLAALFFMKTYREGGAGNFLAAAASTVLTAVSCWYYLPYVVLLAGGLVACGRLWAPETPLLTGARRVVAAGITGGILLIPLAWPLVSAALFASAELPRRIDLYGLTRGHDLLGFAWLGPPGWMILSWPSVLGYSGLLLVALGFHEVRKQKTWLIVLGASWLLGQGASLQVGGAETGLPLPYAALMELPVLGMLRNPDRMFILIELAFAALCAYAWKGIADRIASRPLRALAWMALAALLSLELSAAPLRNFTQRCSPYFAELAKDPGVAALMELPPAGGPIEGRYNLCQTIHGKKIPQGYVTNLAITSRLESEVTAWHGSILRTVQRGEDTFLQRLRERDIDLVVLNKTIPVRRRPVAAEGLLIWQPFGWAAKWLIPLRQAGELEYRPSGDQPMRRLRAVLGEPVHEDGLIAVFPVP
jgi:hypothetical protein